MVLRAVLRDISLVVVFPKDCDTVGFLGIPGVEGVDAFINLMWGLQKAQLSLGGHPVALHASPVVQCGTQLLCGEGP